MKDQDTVRAQFNAQAEKFSAWVGTRDQGILQELFAFVGFSDDDELLDVACGSRNIEVPLYQRRPTGIQEQGCSDIGTKTKPWRFGYTIVIVNKTSRNERGQAKRTPANRTRPRSRSRPRKELFACPLLLPLYPPQTARISVDFPFFPG